MPLLSPPLLCSFHLGSRGVSVCLLSGEAACQVFPSAFPSQFTPTFHWRRHSIEEIDRPLSPLITPLPSLIGFSSLPFSALRNNSESIQPILPAYQHVHIIHPSIRWGSLFIELLISFLLLRSQSSKVVAETNWVLF